MAIKFSLVISTYNEARNITGLSRELITVLSALPIDFEIIFIDDDSPDLTWRVAEGLAGQDARIKVIRRMHARGLASAVVCGWGNSRGEIIGVIDGDLQHPVETLTAMIDKLLGDHEIDIVVASRFTAGGGISKNNFWQRSRPRLAILLGFIFAPKIFKLVRDPLSGYFIMRREVIANRQLRPLGYKILLEVLTMGSYRKIYEVPYVFEARQDGKTKAGCKQYLLYLLQLITLRRRQKQLS